MALVVTLAVLVLVTVAVMAFFVRATANRSIEAARTNSVLAAEVAATAEVYTLAALRNEIFSANNSDKVTTPSTVTYYRPKSTAFAVPQRVPPSATFPAATFPSLLRRSVNETTNGVGETNASAHSTGTASRDGREITAARWNAPQLNRTPGFTAAQVPNWIYISGNGTATATPPADAVGRFAYCIYDTSGLLDANHAGGGDSTELPFKGWLPNADIATSANATIDPATLRQWRSGNLTASELRKEWSQTGGLRPATPGGRQFTSRRDLLRALGANAAGLTGGAILAPDLTHFTRELHAPSLPFLDAQAALGFPAAEKDRFAAFYSGDRTFTGYRDDGTTYSYTLKSGAPVLHRRFSLGKLGRESGGGFQYWLTPTGPGAGISDAAIKAVFGLRWNSAQERWDYTSPDGGNAPTDQIKTLAQVATANRPPDFFEILKAGINPDSLGGRQTQSGATTLTSEEQARQGSTDLHVLRIGASMIDQADNDNYPTRLGFSLGGADIEAAGVEDLPYLFGIALRPQYTRTRATDAQVTAAGGNATTQYGYYWNTVRVAMSPVLFNPHRKGPAAATAPTSLSFELLGGEVSDLGAVGAVQPPFLNRASYTDTSLTTGSLAIPSAALAAFDSYRACPKNINNWGRLMTATISGVAVPNHLFAFTLPFGDPPPTGLIGANPFLVSKATVDAGYNASNQSIPGLPGFLKFRFAGLRIGLSYLSPSGNKRIYDSLGGAVTPGWDGIDTGWLRAGFSLNYAPTQADYTGSFTSPDNLGNNIGALIKLDPRATRHGAFFSYNTGNNDIRLGQISGDPYFGTGTVAAGEMPLGPKGAGTYTLADGDPAQAYPGRNLDTGGATVFLPNSLFTGGTTAASGTSILNIPDRPQDGAVIRANDGFFSDASGSANALRSEDAAWPHRAAPNDSPKRPVILQRPFRNVAELGHVFRDQPWKSLNLSHESSPDLALLDLFSIGEIEPEGVAGKVGANSAGLVSLKSLVRGAGKTLAPSATAYSGTATQAQADAVATNAITALTANKSLTPGEALKTLVASGNATITANLGTIKAERETLARALAGTTQSRTWNVMIDLVAQSGRFPAGQTAAGDFIAGGEERVWIHAAIDRFTGEILDLERESVPE